MLCAYLSHRDLLITNCSSLVYNFFTPVHCADTRNTVNLRSMTYDGIIMFFLSAACLSLVYHPRLS